jgi:hypothetical protein
MSGYSKLEDRHRPKSYPVVSAKVCLFCAMVHLFGWTFLCLWIAGAL